MSDEPELEGPKGFRSRIHVRMSGAQVILTGAVRLIQMDTEIYDTLGEFDPSAGNYTFRPRRPGYYLMTAQLRFANAILTGDGIDLLLMHLPGVVYAQTHIEGNSINYLTPAVTCIVHLTPADYVQVFANTTEVGGSTIGGGFDECYFMVHRLS